MKQVKEDTPKEVKPQLITEDTIKENIVDLTKQLQEAQARVLMLQGAIQISEAMIEPKAETNGVKK
tara:strand:+ start:9331 stop:9528 length:198 start_codon:yes stop_codon:yes gene_type:complete